MIASIQQHTLSSIVDIIVEETEPDHSGEQRKRVTIKIVLGRKLEKSVSWKQS